jgi:hypothetical protein
VQEIGSVLCKEGRLLTFPNTLQHQVQPFSLKDPTKPGHRKILALFLVDPNIKIISTAHVPPQREGWIPKSAKQTPFDSDSYPSIVERDGSLPISLDEAKQLRLKLMEERRRHIVKQGKYFGDRTFALCEH